ncbi:MAG: cobalamin-dependent protein, partial [Deltaproteobacteria bacterium]|nr:cobalamin-dependent protein [Deltaproteobacteria bacterium]
MAIPFTKAAAFAIAHGGGAALERSRQGDTMANVLMIRTRTQPREHIVKAAPIMAPLGLLSLASFARRRRPEKDRFMLIDERVCLPDRDEYEQAISSFCPDLFAISSMSLERDRFMELASSLKESHPHIPIVCGGPLPSSVGTKIFALSPVDFAVRGEGEKPFVRLLEALETGKLEELEKIPGLSFRRPGGEVADGGRNTDFLAPEEFPLPAWDLVDPHDYPAGSCRMTPTPVPEPYAPIVTSRGCPYSCIYCHNIFGKKFRPKSPEQVLEEMEYLVNNHNIRSF